MEYLSASGYRVYEFDTREKNKADFFDGFQAVVFTGMDENVMGIQNANINVPFIEARGMTPQEVKEAVDQKVQ